MNRKPIPGLANLPLLGSLEFELDETDTPDTARSRVSMHLRNEARRQGLKRRFCCHYIAELNVVAGVRVQ
jgi:hypothetical protein